MRTPSLPQTSAWAYLAVFIAGNALLSYFSLPAVPKVLVALFLIALPFILLLRSTPKAAGSEEPSFFTEFFPSPAVWIWVAVALLAIGLRFYKCSTFLVFPLWDEVVNADNALRLNEKWTWYPFFHWSQLPPLYIWILALLFKVFGFSLFLLWFLPAALSASAVLLGALAALKFFSNSFSFVCFVVAAVSFWPLFVGRFSHQAVLMLFWEMIVFLVLENLLHAKSLLGYEKRLLALGACVGLGFYT